MAYYFILSLMCLYMCGFVCSLSRHGSARRPKLKILVLLQCIYIYCFTKLSFSCNVANIFSNDFAKFGVCMLTFVDKASVSLYAYRRRYGTLYYIILQVLPFLPEKII